jgi:phospholipase/carboxylesterase
MEEGDLDTARLAIAMFHGFQMEPADLAPFARSIGLPAWWLFPEAPLPAQPRGRAWWHIDAAAREAAIAKGPRDFAVQHPRDLPDARARWGVIVDGVLARAGARPVIVGGFSQGGMLTIDSMIRGPRPVAGVALLSASRIAFDEWPDTRLDGLPVLVAHGRVDDDLAFAAGEALRDTLIARGADVTWLAHDEGHLIPLVVWRALRRWASSLIR